MNAFKRVSILAAVLLMASGVLAREGGSPFSVSNSLHIEYDDNMEQTATNQTDGFKVSDQITLSLDQGLDQGFLGLSYQLVATWWEPRDDEEFTYDHVLDARLDHRLTPSLSGVLQNKFIHRDSPEVLNPDGTIRRENSTYDYNTLHGSVSLNATPNSRVDLSGRWQFLQYEDDSVADREDYEMYSAGATLVSQVQRETSLLLEGRAERYDYPGAGKIADRDLALPGLQPGPANRRTIPDRSFDSYIGGVGVEQIFSPNLIGRVTVGYMVKDLKAANQDDESSPYAEGTLTLKPGGATTVTAMGSYSLYQSGALTYASQERTAATLSVGHDFTPRFSGVVAGSYANSDYSAPTSVNTLPEDRIVDASEQVMVFSARAIYRLDPSRRHSVEAGWSYTKLDSDFAIREEFDRNRYDVAWRIQF